jgi:hypothetical protein
MAMNNTAMNTQIQRSIAAASGLADGRDSDCAWSVDMAISPVAVAGTAGEAGIGHPPTAGRAVPAGARIAFVTGRPLFRAKVPEDFRMSAIRIARHGIAIACLASLAACQRGEPPVGAMPAPAPRPAATTATRDVPPAACPPEPELDRPGDAGTDAIGVFADDTRAFAALRSRFHQAYAQACGAGWLAQGPLVDPASAHPGALALANAPEANVAAIHLDARTDLPPEAHDTVLEYPFVDADGHARVPSVDELREAIHCRTVGATEAEEESGGRCLPD